MADADIAAFKTETKKIIDFLQAEYSKLQTGRANASIVEHIEVEAYGAKQTLQSVAGISVQDARTIVVQPWDRSIMQDVEKALQKADLGTSPVNDGSVLRINLPPMTEERRSHLAKHVQTLAEEAKISVRHLRHEAMERIKKETDEDVRDTQLERLQKEVDAANSLVEETAKKKNEEVMTV
jgi:ribosome recycling factor